MNWETKITKLLDIRYPIIQGGLAHLAYADLAAAVSNAGGLGQVTAMSLKNPELLKEELRKTKAMTKHPFAVNFAIGSHDRPFIPYVEAALEEGMSIATITGGNPKPVFDALEGTGVKIIVLVAAVRQAQKAEELGADAVIVVGQEGGGHLGRDDLGTMVLVPRVVDAVNIPVVASGGIGDGRGLMAALSLGAEGVEMGTRFIAVKECVGANDVYKQSLIDATERDTVVIKRSLGAPARALSNHWTDKILEMEKQQMGYEGLKDYISGYSNKKYIHEGNKDEGYAWAGQVAGLIQDIPTVSELFDKMIGEADQIRKKWQQ
ncbi:NAD(P)H-dependent flavin oxidoreductase [Bacillus testis]|uniref:NAD(P)H-dependent flavin oxidoreductase n=1 Tax=Bacillus testis TaxID=1622072 RepID=UPI00067F3B77|nr:nitronate monooxygenase family protein [Bacillus testis]